MKISKAELKSIALFILLHTPNPPSQLVNLELAVANEFRRRRGLSPQPEEIAEGFRGADWLVFQEVFWDLIFERVITPGTDSSNAELPRFRIHSEARENLKRLEQAQKQSGL
jgi:hypothetical protein